MRSIQILLNRGGGASHSSAGVQHPRRTKQLTILVLLSALSGCAIQRVQSDAKEFLASGDYESAIKTLEAGSRANPDSAELRRNLLLARTSAVSQLIAEIAAARAKGEIQAANSLVERARSLDPGSLRVRELSQTIAADERHAAAQTRAEALMEKGQHQDALRLVVEALGEDPRNGDLAILRRKIERKLNGAYPISSYDLTDRRPISLDFRDASLRSVIDLVSRNSGINFLLDKDIRSDLRITVFLRNAPVEEALDLIVGGNQLAKKVVDEKTVLIYPNTPEKQREHQEQVIRVFYLASAEAKGAAAFLRSMLKLKEPFVDERSNMLALREPAEIIQLAERLIALYDGSDPEVMLELEVIEIGSTRLTELGVKLPDTISFSVLPPVGTDGLTVANLRRIDGDRVGVSLSSILLNMKRQVGDFELLANPRIRAANREKAKVLIGDKVPVITTTTSQNGFVAENVNYLDVGLKLDLEPTVFADDEVSIKVNLEVSSLASQLRTSTGLVAYQIKTRNAGTTLRLRDGETQVLAGLINREQRSDASRIPLAGDLPVLGRLFSSQLDDGRKSELVLAITPRVLRNIRRPEAHEAQLWIGTENYTRLRPISPRTEASRAGTQGVGDTLPIGGAAPAVATTPTSGPLPSSAPAVPAGASAPVQSPAPAVIPLSLRLTAPRQAKVGQEFSVVANLSASTPVRELNLRLKSDSKMAVLRQAAAGSFFQQDGEKVEVAQSDLEGGETRLTLTRKATVGLTGDGVAANLVFRALQPGRFIVQLTEGGILNTRESALQPLTGVDAISIEIKQ